MACVWVREAAAGHTGQFSWRAGPSGTVLAQHGSAPPTTGGPARGPWVNTGMVRARLAGLSFGPPAPAQPQVCALTALDVPSGFLAGMSPHAIVNEANF